MIEDGTPQDPLVLDRKSELVTAAIVLALWALASWAAAVDWASDYERNATALDWLSIAYKLTSVGALAWVGRRLGSRSMGSLALLLGLLTVGSLVVNSDRLGSVDLGLGWLFAALAIVAGGLVWDAYRRAAGYEKLAVLRLIWILFAVGIFLGPVNAISSLGINREWLFAEDFGQVMSLAVLAGYTIGLVVAVRDRATTLG